MAIHGKAEDDSTRDRSDSLYLFIQHLLNDGVFMIDTDYLRTLGIAREWFSLSQGETT